MSQFPPPPPPAYENPPMDYAPRPKTSGMALTSMILGIVSIPLMCALGIGVIPAIIAIILGIIALSSINRNPQLYGGKGMAITGIATGAGGGLVVVPLLIAILLPSLGKARELANRSTCAANLRGITQSMSVYAADGDRYPVTSSKYGGTLVGSGGFSGTNRDPGALLTDIIQSGNSGNVAQCMWVLVLTNQVAPKQYLCKSDPAAGTPSPSTDAASNYKANFSDDKAYSYSLAFPWANGGKEIGGWWHDDTDASLPIIADMAPASGTGSPAANTLDGTTKNANSFNHQRDGQNIGFGDGHAEFDRLANCGENNDNIYSANGKGGPSPTGITPASAADPGISYSLSPGPRGRGSPPTGFGGSLGNWDVCLVPAADGTTYTRK